MIEWIKQFILSPHRRPNGENPEDIVRQERLRLHSCYQETFSSVSGDAVLEDLCRKFHIGITTFVPFDPQQTARNEGERNVVLYILNILKARPNDGSNTAQ